MNAWVTRIVDVARAALNALAALAKLAAFEACVQDSVYEVGPCEF